MSQPALLLVDDELPILASLRRLLAFEDYRVVTEPDPVQALRQLAQEEFAVVMSDQHMPGMQGVEFLRRARELSGDTSRILFSGHIDIDLLRAAVNGGEVYRFVTKPWDDDEVLAAIRQGIERWQLLRTNARLKIQTERQNRELKRLNGELGDLVAKRTAESEIRRHALGISQRVLDRLPVGVIGVDPGGIVVLVNRLAQRLFPGTTPGEDLRLALGPELAAWVLAAEVGNAPSRPVESPFGPVRIDATVLPNADRQRGLVVTAVPIGFEVEDGWL